MLGKREPEPAEPEPETPKPIRLRSEYVKWARLYVEAVATGNAYLHTAAAELRALRKFAHVEGHGAALDAVWIEPRTDIGADPSWVAWYRAKVGSKLEPESVADPGPAPAVPTEPLYWREKYAAAARAVLAAYRSRDVRACQDSDIVLQNLRRTAYGRGFVLETERWLDSPQTIRGEALDAWERELEHRLAHNGAAGGFYPLPPPPRRLFVTAEEIQESEAARRSGVVLLVALGEHPAGTWLRLDAATSHQLVEEKAAAWARDCPIPDDPRPPVEPEEGADADWPDVEAVGHIKLVSRHRLAPGEHRRVPPDEARALCQAGAAKLYVAPPPPPEPPKVPVVFE